MIREAYLHESPRRPHAMNEAEVDIRRVLTIVFRSVGTLGRADLERTLSFDMEWVAPHEAEHVVSALLEAGWLTDEDSLLRPAVALGEVHVPFGWFPRPNRLLQPVAPEEHGSTVAKDTAQEPNIKKQTIHTEEFSEDGNTGSSDDPRAVLTKRVVKFVARQSGLSVDELQRRAERKIAAFHLITPWLAYALVAREQGLAMDDIVGALAVV
jgi:hypothetical protein